MAKQNLDNSCLEEETTSRDPFAPTLYNRSSARTEPHAEIYITLRIQGADDCPVERTTDQI